MTAGIQMNFDRYACLSFDCYGTLIDWETGLLEALSPVLDNHSINIDNRQILEAYAIAETDAESREYRPYKEVLCDALLALGERYGFSPSVSELERFSISVKNWPPFEDSRDALSALQTKYSLIVLSNIDEDLFEDSAKHLGIAFDKVFTAQTIRSYKPSLRNFQYLIENAGVPKERILHVAQSLFHDITPARELGLSTVWVNRRKGMEGTGATPAAIAQPDIEVSDLRSLASLVGVL